MRIKIEMKYIYIFIGTVSLVLGILGIFLPVLPTTPFLLLTAALYLKGSKRLYRWLMNHKVFGPYIKNFMEHKAIPLKVKLSSVILIWLTLGYCAIAIATTWYYSALFIAIAIGVTIHLLHFKTLKNE